MIFVFEPFMQAIIAYRESKLYFMTTSFPNPDPDKSKYRCYIVVIDVIMTNNILQCSHDYSNNSVTDCTKGQLRQHTLLFSACGFIRHSLQHCLAAQQNIWIAVGKL